MSRSLVDLRSDLLSIVRAGIAAVDPARLLTPALFRSHPHNRSVWIVAAGKAAPAMASAALRALGTSIQGGVVISPTAADGALQPLRAVPGNHPQPGTESEKAGRAALDVADTAGPDDELLVLLSGGASSLMAVPAPGVSLEDKSNTTRLLLRAGADIHALNTVRKHLSRIKGGQLAARTRARTHTFVISDVVGDDLSVIASGPTVADPTTFADALAVVDAHGGRAAYPPAVVAALEAGVRGEREETPKPADARLRRAEAVIVGGRTETMRGAEEQARALGYHTLLRDEAVVGEARDAAVAHLARIRRDAARLPRPLCVISSGETTVKVTGAGKGGRNQEFALALVESLAAMPDAVLASVGTDGVDGPTDAAGAVADSTTVPRASAAGVGDPQRYLRDNDAYRFFDALGDLVRTGPTGTNVGDLQVLLLT